MGSIEGRISRLEGLMPPPKDKAEEERRTILYKITDEVGHLKACRARNVYRGGTPPTPIQPTDPAGEILGYPYTRGQLTELAIRRFFEREREKAPEDLSYEDMERLISAWTEVFRDKILAAVGLDWDEVEAEGPPEPTPPWTFGGAYR